MSNRYLPLFISQVRLELSHVTKIEKAAVERDIAARRHEANIGKLFAYQRERVQREIAKLGVTENQWLKRELGTSLATMLRYRLCIATGVDMSWHAGRPDQQDNPGSNMPCL